MSRNQTPGGLTDDLSEGEHRDDPEYLFLMSKDQYP
jgi:hypothetical protein